MLELRIINAGQTLPLFDLPAHLGRRQAAREVADTIEGLITFLDDLGGDTDLETTGDEDDFVEYAPDGPGCPIADIDKGDDEAGDAFTWPEWNTLAPSRRRAGKITGKPMDEWRCAIGDDEEDDDPDICPAADDDPARIITDGSPGDSHDTELNGDEGDFTLGLPYWEA